MNRQSKILIAGSGGLGKEVLSSVIDNGLYSDIFFLNDKTNFNPKTCFMYGRYPILTSVSEVRDVLGAGFPFICAVGNGRYRMRLRKKLTGCGSLVSQISNRAIISHFSNIGKGSILMPNSGVSNDVLMGDCALINANAQIGHDVEIGNYVTVASNSVILGHSKIGNNVFISANVTILRGIVVGDNAIIGAGTVVDRDVLPYETFTSERRGC